MKWHTTIALILSLLLWASVGMGQTGKVDEARTYFNVGAQAYAKGDYPAAVQAFQEAYRRSPRPGILFSIAQAHRRQYYLDKQPASLTQALDHYRRYLKDEPRGRRRGEAAEAVAELEPIYAKLEAEGATVDVQAPATSATRVMISSPTPAAQIRFDGGSPQELPFISEVKPGKHQVEVAAPGFVTATRSIRVPEGGVLAVDVPLEGKKAHLRVRAPVGAEISVDGRLGGEAPLGALELEPGRHYVTVTKNGRRPYSREIVVGRGESRELSADLETTSQRTTAWVLFAGSAAAVVGGGVLTYLAVDSQSSAEDILAKRETSTLSPADTVQYERARDDRDRYRTMSAVAYGTGAALGVGGLILFVFDSPRPSAAPERDTPSPAAPSMEVSLSPVGGSIHGRF